MVAFSPGLSCSSANGPGWCSSSPTATTDKSSPGGPCTGRAHGQHQLLRKVGPRQVNGLWPDRKPDSFPLCSGLTVWGRNIQKLLRSTLHRPEPPVRKPGQRAAGHRCTARSRNSQHGGRAELLRRAHRHAHSTYAGTQESTHAHKGARMHMTHT